MRKMLILWLVAVCCLVDSTICLAAFLAEGQSMGKRLLEIYPVQRVYSVKDEIDLCYRLTNCAEQDYFEAMPYEDRELVWDWFDVYLNGNKLKNRLAKANYGFLKETKLGPGESVTITFTLGTVCVLPTNAADRVGHYEVRARTISDNAKPYLRILTVNVADFWVAEKLDGVQAAHAMSVALSDEGLGRAFLSCDRTPPADKLKYLQLLKKRTSQEVFLNQLPACTDAHVLTVLLESIGPEIATPEYLFQFIESRDLSVRRACLRNLVTRRLNQEQKDRLKTLWRKGDEIVDELIEKIMMPEIAAMKVDKLTKRLDSITLAEVEFSEEDIPDVVGILEDHAKNNDPDKVGVSIVLMDKKNTSRVTLKLRGTSLRKALDMVAEKAGLSVDVEEDRVVLRKSKDGKR